MRDIVMPAALSISETHFRRFFFFASYHLSISAKKIVFFPLLSALNFSEKKKYDFQKFCNWIFRNSFSPYV